MDLSTTRDINFYESFPRWEATLSNSLIIYSDNKYINNLSDWERLRNFCKEKSLKITNFLIGFRDNSINIENVTYFRRMYMANMAGQGMSYFIIGTGYNNPMRVQIYSIPDIRLFEEEIREVDLGELI